MALALRATPDQLAALKIENNDSDITTKIRTIIDLVTDNLVVQKGKGSISIGSHNRTRLAVLVAVNELDHHKTLALTRILLFSILQGYNADDLAARFNSRKEFHLTS